LQGPRQGLEGEASFAGTVTGRVQGVGFRAFVAASAESLGLHGWVKNLPDGRVELAARGPKAQLVVLSLALKRGPGGARVTAVELDWSRGPEDGLNGFEVRR
jgi:acylphosphatase